MPPKKSANAKARSWLSNWRKGLSLNDPRVFAALREFLNRHYAVRAVAPKRTNNAERLRAQRAVSSRRKGFLSSLTKSRR